MNRLSELLVGTKVLRALVIREPIALRIDELNVERLALTVEIADLPSARRMSSPRASQTAAKSWLCEQRSTALDRRRLNRRSIRLKIDRRFQEPPSAPTTVGRCPGPPAPPTKI